MKMKAIFTVEFEADDDGANARYFLEQALARARAALKDSIEQGEPGTGAQAVAGGEEPYIMR
jgi:hypothetical protein